MIRTTTRKKKMPQRRFDAAIAGTPGTERRSEKSRYVFTFGSVGAGKSTLLAAIASCLQRSQEILFRMNLRNRNGTRFLVKEWLPALRGGDFPPQTRRGEVLEVDIGIESLRAPEAKLGITFLEISGEDLREVDVADHKGAFPQNVETYFTNSDVQLIVVPCDRAREEDALVAQFFEQRVLHRVETPLALVISKWDLVDSENTNVADFVSETMHNTRQWLQSHYVQSVGLFAFSVGKVDTSNAEKARIVELDLARAERIIKWISQARASI